MPPAAREAANLSGNVLQALLFYKPLCKWCEMGAHICLQWNPHDKVFEPSPLGKQCKALILAGL